MLFVLTRLISVSHFSQVTFGEYSGCKVSHKSYHSKQGQKFPEISHVTLGDSTLNGKIKTSSENWLYHLNDKWDGRRDLRLICLTCRWTVLLLTPSGAQVYSPESDTCNLVSNFYFNANTFYCFFFLLGDGKFAGRGSYFLFIMKQNSSPVPGEV